MSAYRAGLADPVALPAPLAGALSRAGAYRAGLADARVGAGYFYHRGVAGVSPEAQPVRQVGNLVMSTAHAALLVGGLAAIARG